MVTHSNNLLSNKLLIVILILSVLLRVGVAFYLGDVVDAPQLLTDQRSYHALGSRLITGHGFSFDRAFYPFTPPDTPTSHWSFLYSVFVAAIYALFGAHPLVARLAGAVLGGLLLPWIVYRLARRLFSSMQMQEKELERLALLSAALAAIYAYFILYAATLMTETFYIVVLLWSFERALILAQRPGARNGVMLGVSLGLATLLRQSVLPWAAVLLAWLLWTGWQTARLRRAEKNLTPSTSSSTSTPSLTLTSTLTSILTLTLFILPFTLRNYVVYDEFLLLNSNAGYAMYSAQHPMHGTDFQEFAAAPLPDELRGLNEAQMDRELMRRGIGFVLQEPGRYALLSLSRVQDYFEFWPTPDTTLLHNIGRVGSFGLFLPFMLYGLWLALRRAGPGRVAGWARFSITPLALVLLFMVFYSLLHIFTWAMPRYRFPVDAVALPFAALAVAELAAHGRKAAHRVWRRTV